MERESQRGKQGSIHLKPDYFCQRLYLSPPGAHHSESASKWSGQMKEDRAFTHRTLLFQGGRVNFRLCYNLYKFTQTEPTSTASGNALRQRSGKTSCKVRPEYLKGTADRLGPRSWRQRKPRSVMLCSRGICYHRQTPYLLSCVCLSSCRTLANEFWRKGIISLEIWTVFETSIYLWVTFQPQGNQPVFLGGQQDLYFRVMVGIQQVEVWEEPDTL